MTSLFIDPALFEAPSEPEPRDQLIVNGRYMLPPIGDPTGKRRSLQRVTNFIKQLSDTEGLTKWKLRTLVVGMARDERLYDLATSLSPDDKRELDDLVEKAIELGQAGPSGGNITGTALHNYTDDLPGKYPIRVRDKWVPKVENLFRALHEKGLRAVPGLSERLVVSERYGTCGRLDDVYEDPWGTLRVGDRKSQKEFQTWWEVGAQLALYQGSDAMWNEAECRFEDMPNLADDFAHVAWMPLKHPAAKKGGDVDTVTIYDLPLAGPREVLDWCLSVRTLRTQARQWGQERVDLNGLARVARDIRDAETCDDLTNLYAAATKMDAWVEDVHAPMAAKRWEQLAAHEHQMQLEHLSVPSPNELARQETVSEAADRIDQGYRDEALSLRATQDVTALDAPAMERLALLADISGNINGVMHHTQVSSLEPTLKYVAGIDYGVANPTPVLIPREMLEAKPPSAEAIVREALEDSMRGFDPALFVAPEQDATFPDIDGAGVAEVPGAGGTAGSVADFECRYEGKWASEHPINIPGYFHCISPEPRPAPMSAQAREGLHTPDVWAAEWGMRIVHPDGWSAQSTLGALDFTEPISHDEFGARMRQSRCQQIKLLHEAAKQVVHPVATTQFTHSKHEGATMVELPDLRTPAEWAEEFGVAITHADGWAGGPGRFVAKSLDEPLERGEFQARLSSSTIADLVTGAHVRKPRTWAERLDLDPVAVAGMPDEFMSEAELGARRRDLVGRTINVAPTLDSVPLKVVREVCTRANNSSSSRGRVRLLNDLGKKYAAHADVLMPGLLAEWLAIDGGPTKSGFVKSTEGSARQPMLATLAGPTTLTDYLATKEVPKSVTITEVVEGAPTEMPDRAPVTDGDVLTDLAQGGYVDTASVMTTVQRFADDVAEVRKPYAGIEPDKHSMLRLIEMAKQAANGAERAKVFHEITRRKAWTGAIAAEINQHYLDNGYATENFDPYFEAQEIEQASPVLLDPDDPSSAADAVQLLEGVKDRAGLTLMWSALASKPWFTDQALQEALLSKMMILKS